MKRSSRPRETAKLSASVNRQLNMYAVAGTAAGVGALALAQPLEAKIVYTPVHVIVGPHQSYGIGFENSGTTNIYLKRSAAQYSTGVEADAITGVNRNSVAVQMDNREFAVAIHDGAKIGFSRHFVEGSSHSPVLADGSATTFASTVRWRGQWANGGRGVKNRYLGVKFTSGGKVHFGWARITITIPDPNRKVFKVLLSGYAYETIPGKAIIAGQTKSTDDNAEQPDAALSTPTPDAPQLPMLGALALGVPGLSIWRREDSVAATSDCN